MSAFGLFGPTDPAATEPHADARAGAAQLWQSYVAMIGQGFTPEQALFLLGQILSGGATGGAMGQALRGETDT